MIGLKKWSQKVFYHTTLKKVWCNDLRKKASSYDPEKYVCSSDVKKRFDLMTLTEEGLILWHLEKKVWSYAHKKDLVLWPLKK